MVKLICSCGWTLELVSQYDDKKEEVIANEFTAYCPKCDWSYAIERHKPVHVKVQSAKSVLTNIFRR